MLELCKKADIPLEDIKKEKKDDDIESDKLNINVDYYKYLIEIDVI